jgi:phage-related protein
MAEGLPDISTRVRVDTSELEAAARKGALVGSAIGSAIGGLASGGISRGVSAITGFVSGSVDAFAQLEDSSAAASVVFGKGMADVTAFAETASGKLGLSEQAAINAANTFGTFGKSAGLQGKELAGFSTGLAELAGDMASFKGTTPEQAIEAVGAALRGEAEPIRAYGVLLDDATLRQEALSMGLIKTTKQALTPQQKVLAAQAAILKQTGDAQGDFARTSDSTANTQKRLAAETANAQAQLGAKLAPALTAVRSALLVALTGLNAFIAGITPLLNALAAMAGFITNNIDVLGPLSLIMAGFVIQMNAARIATALLAAQASIVTAVTKAWAVVQGVLNAVMSANPIGLLVLSIAALVAGVVLAYRNSETFREIVEAAWQSVQNVVGSVVPAVIGFVRTLVGAVTAAWGTVSSATSTVWNKIKSVVEFVWSAISAYVRTSVAGVVAVVKGIAAVVGVVRGAFESAKDAVEEKISAAVAFVKAMPGRVTGGLSGLASAATAPARAAFGEMKTAISEKIAEAIALVKTIDDKVLGALGDLGSLLYRKGQEIIQGLIDGIKSKIGAIGDAMGKVAGKIGSFLPGSPVKEGPLRVLNNGRAGAAIVDMISDGILRNVDSVSTSLGGLRVPSLSGPSLAGAGVGTLGAAAGSSRTWAPQVTLQGTFSDPMEAARLAADELTWQARLQGAPV